ncbi:MULTISPECIES: hypothetical protein [unclassified Luteococcus]|uniref:hypothetical protein n=1 Tax=unclassified Luteococcus TaxID=2639923 RepID=UPI00313C8544
MTPTSRPEIPATELAQRIGDAIRPAVQKAWTSDRVQMLRRVIQGAHMPNASGQKLLTAHHEVLVDAKRAERTATTTLVIEATAEDVRGWSISVDLAQQQVHAEALLGCTLGRVIPVDEGAQVYEFLFDPPLKKGDNRRTQHRLTFHGDAECTTMGYALSRPAQLLTLTVHFEGALPKRILHTVKPAQSEAEPVVERELEPARMVELVLANPAPGLHALDWEW